MPVRAHYTLLAPLLKIVEDLSASAVIGSDRQESELHHGTKAVSSAVRLVGRKMPSAD